MRKPAQRCGDAVAYFAAEPNRSGEMTDSAEQPMI
jgi:hypothetical protein